MSQHCYVYIIQRADDDVVKVGVSGNPDARLSELQCGSAEKLSLYIALRFANRPMAMALERAFHSALSDRAMCGEWFRVKTNEALLALLHAISGGLRRIGTPKDQIESALVESGLPADAAGFYASKFILRRGLH